MAPLHVSTSFISKNNTCFNGALFNRVYFYRYMLRLFLELALDVAIAIFSSKGQWRLCLLVDSSQFASFGCAVHLRLQLSLTLEATTAIFPPQMIRHSVPIALHQLNASQLSGAVSFRRVPLGPDSGWQTAMVLSYYPRSAVFDRSIYMSS